MRHKYDELIARLLRYSLKTMSERLDPDFAEAVQEAVVTIIELNSEVEKLTYMRGTL